MAGPAAQGEPTLAELLGDLWQAKFMLLFGALAGLVLAAGFLAASVPQYRASMLVAPAERQPVPDIKTVRSDNSSFADPNLNSPGPGSSNDYVRFEHTLRQPSVAAALLKNKRVMEGIANARRFTFERAEKVDSAESLAAYLQDHVKIEPVGTTPLRRIVYDHPDRDFGVYLLNQLHAITDHIIRQEIRSRTKSREAYLQQALNSADHPDHRRALTSLLMTQERVAMILAMDEPFAAIIAEPPAATVKPYWPRKAVIFPVFTLAGILLGFMVFGLRRQQHR